MFKTHLQVQDLDGAASKATGSLVFRTGSACSREFKVGDQMTENAAAVTCKNCIARGYKMYGSRWTEMMKGGK